MNPAEASEKGARLAVEVGPEDRFVAAVVDVRGQLWAAFPTIVDPLYSGHSAIMLPTMSGDRPEWKGIDQAGREVTIYEIPTALFSVMGVDAWLKHFPDGHYKEIAAALRAEM